MECVMKKKSIIFIGVLAVLLSSTGHAQNSSSNKKNSKQEENIFIQYSSSRKQSVDHRGQSEGTGRSNEIVKAKRGSIQAPTQVTLSGIKSDSLTINWFDNAKVEYGVSVERGVPTHGVKGVNYHWVRIFNVDERMDAQVKGTGWRLDYDSNLKSNTQYCYRLKTYYKRNQNARYQYSSYSYPVCVYTPLSR